MFGSAILLDAVCVFQRGLARDVKDGVGCGGFLRQFLDGLPCREDHEFDFAALRLVLHLIHH
jgi:hypothetical protein